MQQAIITGSFCSLNNFCIVLVGFVTCRLVEQNTVCVLNQLERVLLKVVGMIVSMAPCAKDPNFFCEHNFLVYTRLCIVI